MSAIPQLPSAATDHASDSANVPQSLPNTDHPTGPSPSLPGAAVDHMSETAKEIVPFELHSTLASFDSPGTSHLPAVASDTAVLVQSIVSAFPAPPLGPDHVTNPPLETPGQILAQSPH